MSWSSAGRTGKFGKVDIVAWIKGVLKIEGLGLSFLLSDMLNTLKFLENMLMGDDDVHFETVLLSVRRLG